MNTTERTLSSHPSRIPHLASRIDVTYRRAGVDVAGADRLIRGLRAVIRSTQGPEVLPDLGQFAGLFRLGRARWRDPVLVASTDGVGTKLQVARLAGRHEGIGLDAVAMNVNDIVIYGAQPLFFLDYIAMGRVQPPIFRALVRGVAEGCRQSGCALLGGETAEMPGVYAPGDYDIAGFCVGAAERAALIDGSVVRAGDAVVGLASSGVHANGFSLVRHVFSRAELKRHARELLAPTTIYVPAILDICRRVRVHGLAHVTGGGLRRRLPSLVARQAGLRVRLTGRWPVPKIFARIQQAGAVRDEEMAKTFNMGLGMVVACRAADAGRVIRIAARHGIAAWVIGDVERSRA